MSHSFTRIYVHLIWSTKCHQRFITNELRPQLFGHILEYSGERNIRVDSLGIQPEHVHLLVNLRGNQNPDDVAKLIKGESSHWINSGNLVDPKFSWQKGYGAFSVSASHLDRTRELIKNQDEHHNTQSFSEELRSILLKHGFDTPDLGTGE